MWKFQDSSVILREIIVEEFRSSKSAVFVALNFVTWEKFQPSKSAKNHKEQNSEPSKCVRIKSPKFDFT